MGKSKKTSRESETYRLMRVKPPVKVTFNVGGTTFQTSEATVKRVKNHNFKVNLIDETSATPSCSGPIPTQK